MKQTKRHRQQPMQTTLPIGTLTRRGLDEKSRAEIVAVLARLLREAADAKESGAEVDNDAT